jgi:hypothetical protein
MRIGKLLNWSYIFTNWTVGSFISGVDFEVHSDFVWKSRAQMRLKFSGSLEFYKDKIVV